MRALSLILAFFGAALVAFGYWGSQTRAGQVAFDEMAGIIPLLAGLLGAGLSVAALALRVWAGRRPK